MDCYLYLILCYLYLYDMMKNHMSKSDIFMNISARVLSQKFLLTLYNSSQKQEVNTE